MRGRSSWKVFQLKRGNENGRVRIKTESGFFKKNQEKFMDSIDFIGKDIEEEKKKLFYENGKLAMNDFPPLLNKMQI